MAASTANPKTYHHTRSISLSSGSHPLTLALDEKLRRLSIAESTSSSSSICHKLAGLQDIYECVEDFLLLTITQQSLSLERQEKWVDGILDGSVMLLDICGTSRDILSCMKRCVNDLQSSFRRRCGDLDLSKEISAYMSFRKKIDKDIQKCLADLKGMNNRCFSSPVLDRDHDLVQMIRMLREVESATIAVFESLLSFFSGPKEQSLVSKLMHTRRGAQEGHVESISEVKKVDGALKALISHNTKCISISDVKKALEALDISFQDIEDGLERVFKRLIKTRVSLLNILNQ